MAVNTLLTKAYAVNIYKYGNRTFSTIPVEYNEPVKVHAANTFTLNEIDNALVEKYITVEEYNDTLAQVNKEQTNAE